MVHSIRTPPLYKKSASGTLLPPTPGEDESSSAPGGQGGGGAVSLRADSRLGFGFLGMFLPAIHTPFPANPHRARHC